MIKLKHLLKVIRTKKKKYLKAKNVETKNEVSAMIHNKNKYMYFCIQILNDNNAKRVIISAKE